MSILPYALAAANRGWHVFPVRPSGKQAAVTGWEHRASTDPGRIRAMFTLGRADCNAGIACGPSGLVVLDLDVTKPATTAERDASARAWCDVSPAATAAASASGAGTLAALCATHGQRYPAATFTGTTPSGGTHLYFTAPPGAGLRNPAAMKVADLGAYAAAALHSEVQRVLRSPRRQHNWALNKAAYNLGRLISAGILPHRQHAEAALQAAGETAHTSTEDTPGGIRAIITAGIDAGIRNPKGTAP